MVAVSSWGNLSKLPHEVRYLFDRQQVATQIKNCQLGIAYGMGMSYGDICLNPGGMVWKTTAMDRFISFDEDSGLFACEAGMLLRDIQRLVIPRGWILPVTPGTQLVTVGGAIANDVHGKNHHLFGSFGNHVQQIKLVRTDGTSIECGPDCEPEWFSATVGGMGLTGIIIAAQIQLRRVMGPWLNTETRPFTNLNEFFRLADDSQASWEHTVAWIDCSAKSRGRGIFSRGNPAEVNLAAKPPGRSWKMPFTPPISLVNRMSLRLLNSAYFNIKKWQTGKSIAHYESFFYPLDNVLNWNRMYGAKGFFQYQSVVPRAVGQDAIGAMLAAIARCNTGSFLAVLKTFGSPQSLGMLSFPRAGVTLALDFPNKGQRTQMLFKQLDAIVREASGRIYLAKDARMPRDLFEAGYPRFAEFLQYRDPGISSAMSRRLIGN